MSSGSYQTENKTLNIAVIGGGLYGCYISLLLGSTHQITLYESKSDLLMGTSGQCCIRLHAGPHYPRSKITRSIIQKNQQEFIDKYPQFLYKNRLSMYCLGIKDCNNNASKVSLEEWIKVCTEVKSHKPITDDILRNNQIPILHKHIHQHSIYTFNEPIFYMETMRNYFIQQINTNSNIKVLLNQEIHNNDIEMMVNHNQYDYIINCTFFKTITENLLKENNISVVYEPCIIPMYQNMNDIGNNYEKSYSFTIMDGDYASLAPYKLHEDDTNSYYVLFHCYHMLLNVYNDYNKAQNRMDNVSLDEMDDIRLKIENDFKRFYDGFNNDFKFIKYFKMLRTKIISDTEFRSVFVWKDKTRKYNNKVIHVFSGKVNNIIEAGNEVSHIINNTDQHFNTFMKLDDDLDYYKKTKTEGIVFNTGCFWCLCLLLLITITTIPTDILFVIMLRIWKM